VEIIVILLFIALIIVSLLANAFRKDGDDARSLVKKLDSQLTSANAHVADLEAELQSRPTWSTVDRAYKAGQSDLVNAVSAEEGLRVAEATKARMTARANAFSKR
jgi:hypothetical protein